MPTLVAGALAVIVLYLLLQMFRAANPAVLARAVKIGGGVLALAVAAFTGIKGELAVALPLGIFGAGLLGWAPFGTPGFGQIAGLFGGGGGQRSNGQASRVRSPFFEMTLDHDTNALTGTIVSGPNAGRSLGDFDLPALLAMYSGRTRPAPASSPRELLSQATRSVRSPDRCSIPPLSTRDRWTLRYPANTPARIRRRAVEFRTRSSRAAQAPGPVPGYASRQMAAM